MFLQNMQHYKNINIYTDVDKFLQAATGPRAKDWDILDIRLDVFVGLVVDP